MKATLEFDLDDVDDKENHRICVQARDLVLACQSFVNDSLRRRIKYQCDNWTDSEYDLLEEIRQEFYDKLHQYDINIDI